jgi:hypothetical protein
MAVYLREMRWMKWFSVLAAVTMMVSCFYPWVIVVERGIVISGVDAAKTSYGKPGYLNLTLGVFYVVLSLIPRLWARRVNIFVATINFAWMIRNFLVLSRCEAGDCPEKKTALIVFMAACLAMLVGAVTTPANLESSNVK